MVQRLAELHDRRQKLEDAHIYKGSINFDVYERHCDRLQEEIAFAELELHDSHIDAIDVKGILAFAEHLISNLGNVWMEASLQQRQAIQTALFPNGLPFDAVNFGTAVTCLMFSRLEGFSEVKNDLASPMPASWNQIVPWLRQIDGLRAA